MKKRNPIASPGYAAARFWAQTVPPERLEPEWIEVMNPLDATCRAMVLRIVTQRANREDGMAMANAIEHLVNNAALLAQVGPVPVA